MKQEQSRVTKRPAWERFYLDFFLLIPGIYAFLVMRGWAKPAKFLARVQGTGEQYRDPLLFVAPALFAIAISMIMLRLVPVFVKILANIVERFPGAWAYLSFQQIARRPQDHTSALMLIMISLSLSIFSASSAKTLDKWLIDSVYYSTGSDLAVHEAVMQGGTPTAYGSSGSSGGSAVTISDLDINTEGYVSIEDHLKLPSVLKATRVGKYRCTYSYGVGEAGCLIMGIDRLDFPAVGYFRDDFAFTSLGGMMNAIAIEPYSVIVPLLITFFVAAAVISYLTSKKEAPQKPEKKGEKPERTPGIEKVRTIKGEKG
jgi:putative ABC transport system permease protein